MRLFQARGRDAILAPAFDCHSACRRNSGNPLRLRTERQGRGHRGVGQGNHRFGRVVSGSSSGETPTVTAENARHRTPREHCPSSYELGWERVQPSANAGVYLVSHASKLR
jgi:hypothetical protein